MKIRNGLNLSFNEEILYNLLCDKSNYRLQIYFSLIKNQHVLDYGRLFITKSMKWATLFKTQADSGLMDLDGLS